MTNTNSKSPLSEISLELKFPNFYNIKENIPKFYDKIKSKFSYTTVNTDPKIDINITNQNGEIKTIHEPNFWMFHENKSVHDSPITIKLGKDNCILDFNVSLGKYYSFTDFKNDYVELLIKALSVFKIKEVSFVSLRYINIIFCKNGHPLE